MTACTIWEIDYDTVCGDPAVAQLTLGCVHEHIIVDQVCEYCLGLAVEGDLLCTEPGCDPHDCQLVLILEDALPVAECG